MRFSIIVLMLLDLVALAIDLKVAYVDILSGNLKILNVESGKAEDTVKNVFLKLSDPPLGFTSCVPKNVLRVYFKIGNLLVIDLRGEEIEDLNFDEERCLLHQILLSLFMNLKDVEDVKILIDGGKRNRLVEFVDISLSFPRELWSTWPQR